MLSHTPKVMKTNILPGHTRANPLWRSFLYFSILVGLGFAIEEPKAVQPSPSVPTRSENLPPVDAWKTRAAALEKETDRDLRQEGLTVLGREMGSSDPLRSWQMRAQLFPSLRDLHVFSVSLLRNWAMKAPQEALAAAADLPEGAQRAEGYAEALEGWARTAPRDAGLWTMQHLFGVYRRDALARIGKVWAYKAPLLASQWALQHSNQADRIFALTEVVETWAETDPLKAAEWANGLSAGNTRDLALSKALFKWADFSPQAAADWLMAHDANLWLLPRVIAHWGRQDPATAAAWLQPMKDDSLVMEARQAIAKEWAAYNPKAAVNWSRATLKGDEREAALAGILEVWASDYPLEALAWVRSIKGKEERQLALEMLFEVWCSTDLDQAALWVKQQPPGLEKDLGTEQVAGILVATDPPAALNMLLSMQNKSRLQQNLTRYFEDWKQREAAAAENWLKKHPAAVKLLTP